MIGLSRPSTDSFFAKCIHNQTTLSWNANTKFTFRQKRREKKWKSHVTWTSRHRLCANSILICFDWDHKWNGPVSKFVIFIRVRVRFRFLLNSCKLISLAREYGHWTCSLLVLHAISDEQMTWVPFTLRFFFLLGSRSSPIHWTGVQWP